MVVRMSSSSSSTFSIGNCKVEVEGSGFVCESSNQNDLQISLPHPAKIKITVEESPFGDYSFLVLNPKEIDSRSKSMLQEAKSIYAEELPAMNYAANTGKQSQFLEKCVFNGKYCTLLLKSKTSERPGVVRVELAAFRFLYSNQVQIKVIAAITYQIIPTDTQYAEVPLAAVSSNYQHKGLGKLLYSELRKRLQNIGIRTIFCWGDQESEGFWLKQGFVPIAEVNSKGKASKLPVKANIRKALCYPGDSTLMVSHLNKDIGTSAANVNSLTSGPSKSQELRGDGNDISKNGSFEEEALLDVTIPQTDMPRPQVLVKDGLTENGPNPRSDSMKDCEELDPQNREDNNKKATGGGLVINSDDPDGKLSCSGQKRVWEASFSSLKSKKVRGGHSSGSRVDSDCYLSLECDEANKSCFKAGHCSDSRVDSGCYLSLEDEADNSCLKACSLGTSIDKSTNAILRDQPDNSCQAVPAALSRSVHIVSNEDHAVLPKGECHRVMLMNIADDVKKTFLTKIIGDLGGAVTLDGNFSTHVVTGKARRTLNFCTALSSGAWILSTNWLKTSFRENKFAGELPYVLQDEDYSLKYKTDLKDAVLRAKANPGGLLKGYEICFAKHVQPPVNTLSAIVKSAGGQVLHRLSEVQKPSQTIFVACEQDMEDALLAAQRGLWTYSSDWFMNCVMKQELDLQAPQFAESL